MSEIVGMRAETPDVTPQIFNVALTIKDGKNARGQQLHFDTLDLPRDITAYELGVLLRTVVTIPADYIERIPECVRRFFVPVEPKV